MTTTTVGTYTFNPRARTVLLTSLQLVEKSRIISIYDETIRSLLYSGGNDAQQTSLTGKLLTLPTGSIPTTARASDTLRIVYDTTPAAGTGDTSTIVGDAPTDLDTLGEIAAALAAKADATATASALAAKANSSDLTSGLAGKADTSVVNAALAGKADGAATTAALAAKFDAAAAAAALLLKQDADADLAAIAALSTTSYGRQILTIADAAAAGAYFGLANPIIVRPSALTGTAKTTADNTAITDAITLGKSSGRQIVLLSGNFQISTRLDNVAHGLYFHGQGRLSTIIKQMTANTAGMQVGGIGQDIGDFCLRYQATGATALSTDTNANGIEFNKSGNSKFTNIEVDIFARGFYIPQVNFDGGLGLGSTQNWVFSDTFSDIVFNGFSICAINMISFSGGSTGSHWTNTYIHNNYFGTIASCTEEIVRFGLTDELVFNQLNLEWCNPGYDALSFVSCGPVVINGLHFEQVTLGPGLFNQAFISCYDSRMVINGVVLSADTVTSANGTHAVLKVGQPTDFVTLNGFRMHDLVTTGATFPLVFVNGAGAVGASVYVYNAETTIGVGSPNGKLSAVKTGEPAYPTLPVVKQVNDIVYAFKNGAGKNVFYGTAAPASGTWAVGDTVWNTAPTFVSTLGWVCTTAGTPGTWRQIDPVTPITAQVTASGTTVVLAYDSAPVQVVSGTVAQVFTLATSSVVAGQPVTIVNNSTGLVTVNASGGTLCAIIPSGGTFTFTAQVATPTTNLQWSVNTNESKIGTIGFDYLPSAVATLPRTNGQDIALVSGDLQLTYLTADKTVSVSNMRATTGSAAAGATPTLIRYGIYTVAANGDLTLVASTPNDTTMLAAAYNSYGKALSSAYTLVMGQRYAFGILVVSAAAMPVVVGSYLTDPYQAPRLVGNRTGQTDLPASITSANVNNGGVGRYLMAY